MTDNIIPLRGITLHPHVTTEAAESEPPVVTDITPERAEMYMALVHSAQFLLDNKDRITYFVLGMGLKPEGQETTDLDVGFHVHTSPISTGDFALALRLLDNTFLKGINGEL